MAQIIRAALCITLLFLLQSVWSDDRPVPPEGIRAEMEQRWDDAIALYKEALKADPSRDDLWLRIADIHTARKEVSLAADATEEAARLRPDDVALQRRLSQVEAIAGRKEKALAAIRRVVALSPGNVESLRAQAELANWNDDLKLAAANYEALIRLDPADGPALLGLARIQSRQGRLDEAVDTFERYRKAHPDDAEALLSYADTEFYRGNFGHAEALQDHARAVASETPAWKKARANLRARSARPTEALAIDEDLLKGQPNDFDLNLIRTIALQAQRRPSDALKGLATLDRLGPNRLETRDTHLLIETPLRPQVRFSGDAALYSDSTQYFRTDFGAAFYPTPETRLSFGTEWLRMGADKGSGLESLNGSRFINMESGWGQVRYQASPWIAGEVGLGWAENEHGEGTLTYQVAADVNPCDRFMFRLEQKHDIFTVSPRTIDRLIERYSNRIFMDWQPTYRVFIDAEFQYDLLSDGNRVYDVALAPRVGVSRTQHLNVDLGLRGEGFGYQEDGQGYYSPNKYLRLRSVMYAYWKISDNDGIGFVLGAGPERDPDLDKSMKFGAGGRVEGTFGIYRNCQLKAYVACDWREGADATGKAPIGGGFNGRSVGLEILVRF